MSNNILNDIQKILRGKNGSIFFVILIVLAVIFFFKALPSLIWFVIMAGLVFLAFRYFEKKDE